MSLFLAAVALGDGRIVLEGKNPIGLAPSTDGAFWFSEWTLNQIGLVRADGSVAYVRISASVPFGNERHAAMLGLADGSVIVGSVNGLLAHVGTDLQYTVYDVGEGHYPYITDLALGPDGNPWFVAANARLLGTLRDGRVITWPLSSTPWSLASGVDHSLYIASSDGILRASTDGVVEPFVPCSQGYCGALWIEVTADGTIWFPSGRISPAGELVAGDYRGVDATVGPDGNVWVADQYNVIRRIDRDGSYRDFPQSKPYDEPVAIAASEGAIWYAIPGAIERLGPDVTIDLALGAGDLVVHTEEQNCCFEGTHPVLAFHRRGAAPFARRAVDGCTAIDYGGCHPPAAVYADRSQLLFESYGELAAVLLDRCGRMTDTLPDPEDASPAGLVLDRAGTIYALRDTNPGYRLLAFASDGPLLRDLIAPIDAAAVGVRNIDLAADQCTLYYAGSIVGRMNVCTNTLLAPLVNESALDVRILSDGDVLVVRYAGVVRYASDGRVVREIAAPESTYFYAIALDVDRRYFWIGTSHGMWRTDLETGAVVERIDTYGTAVSMAVIAEPRAARGVSRQRSIGR